MAMSKKWFLMITSILLAAMVSVGCNADPDPAPPEDGQDTETVPEVDDQDQEDVPGVDEGDTMNKDDEKDANPDQEDVIEDPEDMDQDNKDE
jgi:PBP1b-binding outer membrane lipoprotein LpoB